LTESGLNPTSGIGLKRKFSFSYFRENFRKSENFRETKSERILAYFRFLRKWKKVFSFQPYSGKTEFGSDLQQATSPRLKNSPESSDKNTVVFYSKLESTVVKCVRIRPQNRNRTLWKVPAPTGSVSSTLVIDIFRKVNCAILKKIFSFYFTVQYEANVVICTPKFYFIWNNVLWSLDLVSW
jgi:hypothetical protein